MTPFSSGNVTRSRNRVLLYGGILLASASVLAVDERQSLETLTRDERTAGCVLAQLKEKHKDRNHTKDRLTEEAKVHSERKAEVRLDFFHNIKKSPS
jgi:hypothetical protein